jgi:hypothetical protein
MNGLRCPNCDLVNLLSAKNCHRCGSSLQDLPATAQVSVPVEETFQARSFAPQSSGGSIPPDNELGKKTYFWYRVYLASLAGLSLFGAGIGVFLLIGSQSASISAQEAQEFLLMGIIYGILGFLVAIIYAVALFLPKKPWNWIVGIVFIAFGMTSCCTIPAAIPLLIFWIKPETKAVFGRN